MAAIFCIIDGMTDETWAQQVATMPYWQRMAQQGATGWLQTTPMGQEADSVGCILRLLGYGAAATTTMRGWVEALGCGISFSSEDLLLRASWIALDERQHSVGFTTPLCMPKNEGVIAYYSLGSYKAMLVLQGCGALLESLQTTAPHQQFGMPLDGLLPQGYQPLNNYLQHYRQPNQILIPWGAARVGALPPFTRQACLIGGCSTALGIGRALQLPVLQPALATGDVDTNLQRKVNAALQAAERYPLVILHINGADEAAHRKERDSKSQFLQQVDAIILAQLWQGAHRVLVTADHGSSPLSGKHLATPQPFVLVNGTQQGKLGILPAAAGLEFLLQK